MSNIKLKPIEPGMVIHCPTEENAKELLKHLDELGYVWTGDKSSLLDKVYYQSYRENTCYETEENGIVFFGSKDFFEKEGYTITEFSDLVEPDMSAGEILDILGEIANFYCANGKCSECPLNYENSASARHYLCGIKSFPENKQKIIEICQQWKEQHEKKEPEVKWHYVATVSSAVSTSTKNCETEEETVAYIEEELKRLNDDSYCGKYERVCRIKESQHE